ncbi:NAD-dependent epimerase/dehydratase family protein [Algoriphagus resistens]|uniref:NAD-dependent epimerase/dehydratase family protein n=1 Tax=Algoriphagus resistens TaxID=1750590 RepID=UPI000716A023|nr:NAD-dependent epimerase/dehydratase family protein [Algoriphagus resistens]
MKILLTGGNGFLGKNIQAVLRDEHTFITLGRSQENQLVVDLATEIPMMPTCDMVVHAAGKAHSLPKETKEERDFFNINSGGTKNLLEGINKSGKFPKAFVFISTVAIYGVESGEKITESFPLNGNTPYALSKIEAENHVREWGENYGVNVVILRLPLIIGKDAPGNFGAMVKAIQKGYYFRITGMNSKKSMVMANDIGRLIPSLTDKNGTYNLTDGVHPHMAELDMYIASQFQKKVWTVPKSVLLPIAKIGDLIPKFPLSTYRLEKLTNSLTFDDQKAVEELGWSPRPVIGTFRVLN